MLSVPALVAMPSIAANVAPEPLSVTSALLVVIGLLVATLSVEPASTFQIPVVRALPEIWGTDELMASVPESTSTVPESFEVQADGRRPGTRGLLEGAGVVESGSAVAVVGERGIGLEVEGGTRLVVDRRLLASALIVPVPSRRSSRVGQRPREDWLLPRGDGHRSGVGHRAPDLTARPFEAGEVKRSTAEPAAKLPSSANSTTPAPAPLKVPFNVSGL